MVHVNGTIRLRSLPKGKELWLLRIYPNHDEFVPMRRANVATDGTWMALDCQLGGGPGAPRTIGAYLIDETSQIFFQYFREASDFHNEWMDRKEVPIDAKKRYLPPIKGDPGKIKSMHMCHEVTIARI